MLNTFGETSNYFNVTKYLVMHLYTYCTTSIKCSYNINEIIFEIFTYIVEYISTRTHKCWREHASHSVLRFTTPTTTTTSSTAYRHRRRVGVVTAAAICVVEILGIIYSKPPTRQHIARISHSLAGCRSFCLCVGCVLPRYIVRLARTLGRAASVHAFGIDLKQICGGGRHTKCGCALRISDFAAK